ncbi:MAG: NAD(+) diphosphatase [Clostridiales bacterium]
MSNLWIEKPLRFFLTDMPDTVPENCQLYPTAQRFRELQPAHHAFAACTAEQIYRWRSSHRICGCCGTFMNNSTTERAAVCPNCGNTVYPKISPAIIVAITDHNRLLMAKNRNSLYKRYALIAGFVEIGESFEEAVQREAGEEVGIKIKNIRYYKSQPWGFSDSIMVGFFADLDGEDALTIQESELKEARWFSREDIPENPIRLSISQELIEAVRNGEHLRYK